MTQGEGDPPGYHKWRAGDPATQTGQRQCVSIVGVEKRTAAELPKDRRNDPGVEAGTPGCGANPDSGPSQTAGQLTPRAGDDDLLQASAVQLASEQPHLSLATAPLPARSDVNDERDQVPGSMASEPLSRATSASSVRSSDRLKGL